MEAAITVIVWDGKTLAADKQSTVGTLKRTVTKIVRIGQMLVGCSGDGDQCQAMKAWVRRGRKPDEFPDGQTTDKWSPTLVIRPGGIIELYEQTAYPTRYEDKQFALGSGRDFAIAAMHLGKSAKEAVEIACVLDAHCGGGVDTLTLKK